MGAGIRIEMLGGFRVVAGGVEIGEGAWPARRASELVALLALADGHRLPRNAVIDALWPHLAPDAGAANLRKAAHHARQALGSPEAVVLRGGSVALFPGSRVTTDVADFEGAARAALSADDVGACEAAAGMYTGHLLPDSPYEEWTQQDRARLCADCVELLRVCEQWERIAEIEPTDEVAYRELMRRELEAGTRPAAIRWYGRLRSVLRRELGLAPSSETQALYDKCIAGLETESAPYVGRQIELARATALLRSADPGGSAAIVLRGSAGVGKTAFCAELERIAAAEGWCVLTATATEAGAPYAPLARLVEGLEASHPDARSALGERGRAVIAELTGNGAGSAPPTRHQVLGALRRLFLAASSGSPVLLVADDVHVADEATIDALAHIGSGGTAAIVTVLSHRREMAPPGLGAAVARLARAGRAAEIDLGPLEAEEAVALVEAASPTPRGPDVIARIVRLAEGNPFLTLELARSAVVGVSALVRTAGDAITARLVDLDESATAALRRLALAGSELDPGVVVALVSMPEPEAFALLDKALAHGVLVVSEGRYRFRHDLVRQALIDQLSPHEQVVAHREAAAALDEADAPAGLIAHHWLAGGRADEAVQWLMTAARRAVALGAYADAVEHLRQLLDHEPRDREALELRAEALDALGDGRAPAAYAEAAAVSDAETAQELQAKRALATIKQGDAPGALTILEGVEAVTTEGRLAQALALCGAAALGFADPAVGTAKAAEARRLALRTGDRDSAAIASWAHAAAAHARGELRDSVEADLRETRSLPKLAVSVFDGQLCITQRLLYGARPYADVIEFADALATQADRIGAARGKAFAVTIRGEAKLLSGALDEAEADLVRGAELHRDLGAATGEAFALQRRAELAMHRGSRDDAAALLDEALAIASESDVGFHLLDRIYGTRVALAPDDPQASLAALEEAEAAVRGPIETCPGCRITFAVPAAIAAARAGDAERLAEWEQNVEYLANVVMKLPAWDAALEEVRAHSATLAGDRVRAAALFAAAAAGFGAAGHPLDEARCAALAAT